MDNTLILLIGLAALSGILGLAQLGVDLYIKVKSRKPRYQSGHL